MDNLHTNGIVLTISTWTMTFVGWVAHATPVLQCISLLLAIGAGFTTMYYNIKKIREKKR